MARLNDRFRSLRLVRVSVLLLPITQPERGRVCDLHYFWCFAQLYGASRFLVAVSRSLMRSDSLARCLCFFRGTVALVGISLESCIASCPFPRAPA